MRSTATSSGAFGLALLLLALVLQTSAEPIPLPLPRPVPLPEAIPEPTPAPVPAPEPIPEALAEADPNADPSAQGSYTYAPFSGAIYVIGANGAAFSQASPAICPGQASQGCGNINIWNWCCPSSNTCVWLSNSVVGCCPVGASCGGTVNAAAIQTVTVTEYVQQTQTQYVNNGPTNVVVVGQQNTVSTLYYTQPVVSTVTEGQPGATVVDGIYVTTNQQQQTTSSIVYNGYCSTLKASGPNLPTTARGACGTILVVNAAQVRNVGWRLPMLVAIFYALPPIFGYFGFRLRS